MPLANPDAAHAAAVTLRPVDSTNWRAVVALRITPAQQATVSELSHRLLLCHYEDMWQPPTLDGRTEGEVCTDARFWLWHNVRFGNRLTAP